MRVKIKFRHARWRWITLAGLGLLGWFGFSGPAFSGTQDQPEPGLTTPAALPMVVIDPGHGGKDTGTSLGNALEKDYVMAVARALGEGLKKTHAANVAYTRDRDQSLSALERATLANQKAAAVFISLHVAGRQVEKDSPLRLYLHALLNGPRLGEAAADEKKVDSRMVPWDLAQNQKHAESLRLAKTMQMIWQNTPKGVRGVCRITSAPLAVLSGVNSPAVLVELPLPAREGKLAKKNEDSVFRTAKMLAASLADFLNRKSGP